jgi:hypothetical protein
MQNGAEGELMLRVDLMTLAFYFGVNVEKMLGGTGC